MEVDAAGNISHPSPQLAGDWKLKEIWDSQHSDKPRPLPTGSGHGAFTFHISEQSDDNDIIWNLSVRIGNNMRTTIKLMGNGNDDLATSSKKKIEVGPVMGTRMLVSEELTRLENYLSAYLPQMKFVEVSPGGLLVMTSTNGGTAVDDKTRGGKIVCEATEATQT